MEGKQCTSVACLEGVEGICDVMIQEYEEGTSPEAIFVKDLDKFDMIFQAFEYERCEFHFLSPSGVCVTNNCCITAQDRLKELQQFFDSTKGETFTESREWNILGCSVARPLRFCTFLFLLQGNLNILW